MASIDLVGVTKTFGKVTALKDVSLSIRDKEFFVLFGPAGAGKTTILNIIAGIQTPNSGLVKINGEVVNHVEPQNRNVAMVFENYALYPHISVYDNMASPLRSPKYKKDEEYIKETVHRIAKLIRIDKFLDRLPSQLSNGQKQRVALGRALVRYPNMYLMDEPLAHLDAKLRNFMRSELKIIQSNFDTTSIYVTHDFMEAMSLGDRIAVINEGEIVQIGTSDEIYYLPCNEFVAQLMGDPEINLFDASLDTSNPDAYTVKFRSFGGSITLPKDDELYSRLKNRAASALHIGIRPQNIDYCFEPREGFLKGTVNFLESIGNKSVLVVKLNDDEARVIVPNGLPAKLDQDVYVSFNMSQAMFFDANSTDFIGSYNEASVKALAEERQQEVG